MLIVLSKGELQALATKNGVDLENVVKAIKREAGIPSKGISSVEEHPTNIYIWYKNEYVIDLINEDIYVMILDPAAVMTMCSEELRAKWFTEEEQLLLAKEIDKSISMSIYERK